jgi:hypothetical protein
LPRSFEAASPSSPFPLAAQRSFHRLLFDALSEGVESYRTFWASRRREPWFKHKRLLGTVLDTATAAAEDEVEFSSDYEDEYESDEDRSTDAAAIASLPRIRTHMRQIGMEHGVALVSHERLPTAADETIPQAEQRISAMVARRVAHMEDVSARTPTLQQSLGAAAAHIAALTLGSAGTPPPASVKLPSMGQSVLEHEMSIVNAVLAHQHSAHPSSAASVAAGERAVAASSVPAASPSLDLSLDSSGEWEALEARESIVLTSELADRLLAEEIGALEAQLRAINNARSSSQLSEQLRGQQAATEDSGGSLSARKNRRSPISMAHA